MSFRLRTRLLLSSLMTLILLVILVVVVSLRVLALNPSLNQLNRLNALAVQTRDLSLRTQTASSDLNAALTGVTTSLYQAQDFDRQLALLGTALDDLARGGTDLPAALQDQISALRRSQGQYQLQGNALFAAAAKRQADPTPKNREIVALAIENTSRLSGDFGQLIGDLNLGVQQEAALAESRLSDQVAALITLLIALAVVIVVLVTFIQLRTARAVVTPVSQLVAAARRLEQGEYAEVAIRAHDEVGELARTFNTMAGTLLRNRAELESQNHDLETAVAARTSMLQDTIGQLEQSLAQRSQLQAQLQGVATPVLPVAAGVLLMPLIGALDEERARGGLTYLLGNIERERCDIVILDITGLSLLDNAAAATLIRTAEAARLLGAETIVCGMTPEVAQSLAHHDNELALIRPVANLQAAVALALAGIDRRD